MQDDMVFVSNGAERNEEILALTAAVLLPTVSSVFGPGIVRDSKGRIITVESAGIVAGQYTRRHPCADTFYTAQIHTVLLTITRGLIVIAQMCHAWLVTSYQ